LRVRPPRPRLPLRPRQTRQSRFLPPLSGGLTRRLRLLLPHRLPQRLQPHLRLLRLQLLRRLCLQPPW
jgi:hypothetical protein